MTKSDEIRGELMVVTGASTGIGAATAHELAAKGYHVLAGVRSQHDSDRLRSERIEPVLLDVTVEDHIRALAERVEHDPLRRPLRALINNAGIEINAPVEVLPIDDWRRQMEVNFFGPVALIQRLLPSLRRSHGRIVNISSVGGVAALPIYGAYAGSKFALEAMSDALRREVSRHGVQVVVVQPGGVKSVMAERSGALSLKIGESMSLSHKELYADLIVAAVKSQTAFLKRAAPTMVAAKRVARAATAARPRTRYTIGVDAAFVVPLARLLPTRLLDGMLSPIR